MIDRIRGYLWYLKFKLHLLQFELSMAVAKALKRFGRALRSFQD